MYYEEEKIRDWLRNKQFSKYKKAILKELTEAKKEPLQGGIFGIYLRMKESLAHH